MAVFRYKAMKAELGESVESGIVVARDKHRAKAKLKKHGFGAAHLENIRGIRALWKRLSADIK